MLLKSASTPVLESLVSSFFESPINNHYQCDISISTPKQTQSSCYSKLSYNHCGSHRFDTVSCNSSPISPAFGNSNNGFRRAQSEGNLESLVNTSNNVDELGFKATPNKFARRRNSLVLETIPSFSFHHLSRQREDEESDEEDEIANEDLNEKDELYGSYNQFGTENMSVQEKVRYAGGYGDVKDEEEMEGMYLAKGLGVADFSFANGSGPSGGHGGGGGYRPVSFDRDGGDSHDLNAEEHYKKMLEENPSNPLFLRNYAQFLYQIKRDLKGAEEYYSRAILADPSDGEVLSHYAKLVWELHRDEDRATSYFERAVQAAYEDSHVHAAYASFLWEIEDEDEDEESHEAYNAPPLFHPGTMTTISK